MCYKIAKSLKESIGLDIMFCIGMNFALFMTMFIDPTEEGRIELSALEYGTIIFVWALVIVSYASWLFPIIYFAYVNKHPEKFAYGEPYRINLCYITDSHVFSDLSKAKNIQNANKVKAEEIIVQRTYKKKCFREVVTGKIYNVFADGINEEEIGFLPATPLVDVNSKELEEYIQMRTTSKYTDFNSFEKCLSYYEKLAKDNYEKAAADADVTEYSKKQRILANIK